MRRASSGFAILVVLLLVRVEGAYYLWNGTIATADFANTANYAFVVQNPPPASPSNPSAPVNTTPGVSDYLLFNADCAQQLCFGCAGNGGNYGNLQGVSWTGVTVNTSCIGGGPLVKFNSGTTVLGYTAVYFNSTFLFAGGNLNVNNPVLDTYGCLGAVTYSLASGTPVYPSLTNEPCLSVFNSISVKATATKLSVDPSNPGNFMFLGPFNITLPYQTMQTVSFKVANVVYFGGGFNLFPYNFAVPATSYYATLSFQTNILNDDPLIDAYFDSPFNTSTGAYFYLYSTRVTIAKDFIVNIPSSSPYPSVVFQDRTPYSVPSVVTITGRTTLSAGVIKCQVFTVNITGAVIMTAGTQILLQTTQISGYYFAGPSYITGAISGGQIRVQVPSLTVKDASNSNFLMDWGLTTSPAPNNSVVVYTGTYNTISLTAYSLSDSVFTSTSTVSGCTFSFLGNATAEFSGSVKTSMFNISGNNVITFGSIVSGNTFLVGATAMVTFLSTSVLSNNVVTITVGGVVNYLGQ